MRQCGDFAVLDTTKDILTYPEGIDRINCKQSKIRLNDFSTDLRETLALSGRYSDGQIIP